MPRLESSQINLVDRLEEAKEQGWLGEVAAIESTRTAAEQKLAAIRSALAQHTSTTTTLGMLGFRPAAGKASSNG
jgi:hypothetical protein